MTLALMLHSRTTSSCSVGSLNTQVMETRCQFCIQPCPAVCKTAHTHQHSHCRCSPAARYHNHLQDSQRDAGKKWQKLPFPRKSVQSLYVYSAAPTYLPCTTATTLSSKSKPCALKVSPTLWLEKTIPK